MLLVVSLAQVYAQVTVLFEGAKDLLDEFKQFLPDTSAQSQPQQQPQQRECSASADALSTRD